MSSTARQTGGTAGEDPWDISDRLRKARESGTGLKQKEFAAATGISIRTISDYENPKYTRKRNTVFLARWALITGFQKPWLELGIGPARGGGPEGGGDLLEPSSRCTVRSLVPRLPSQKNFADSAVA